MQMATPIASDGVKSRLSPRRKNPMTTGMTSSIMVKSACRLKLMACARHIAYTAKLLANPRPVTSQKLWFSSTGVPVMRSHEPEINAQKKNIRRILRVRDLCPASFLERMGVIMCAMTTRAITGMYHGNMWPPHAFNCVTLPIPP